MCYINITLFSSWNMKLLSLSFVFIDCCYFVSTWCVCGGIHTIACVYRPGIAGYLSGVSSLPLLWFVGLQLRCSDSPFKCFSLPILLATSCQGHHNRDFMAVQVDFSFLFALANASRAKLNMCGENGQPYLVLDFSRISLSFHLIRCWQ